MCNWCETPSPKRTWRKTLIETLLISAVVGVATGLFFALLVILT